MDAPFLFLVFAIVYSYFLTKYSSFTFSGMEEGSLRRLSNLTDEYAQDILVGAERKAFIQEHGICILKNDALQQLRQL